MPSWEDRPALVATAIGAAYLVVQLCCLGAYGATWDEPLHQIWGHAVTTYFTTGDRGPLANLPGYGTYYGPLYYWLSSVVTDLGIGSLGLPPAAALHVLNVLTASVGVGLTFLFASEAAGPRAAALATGFLVLFPPLVAHAHYNPKDVPLMTAVVATMLFAQRALTRGRLRDAVIAGLLYGAALTAKLTALFAGGAIGLAWVAGFGERRRRADAPEVEDLRPVGAFVAAALAAMYVLWPTAWEDPLLVPRSVAVFLTAKFFSGTMLYFGTRYAGAALPWHYTPVSLAMVTPVLTLLAFGIGVVVLARRATRLPTTSILLLAWIFVPLAVSLAPGLIRYDGMRQFFFVVPALAVVAGIGADAVLRRMRNHRVAARAFLAAGALWLGGQVAQVYPFGGSYVNEAVRLAIPSGLERWVILEGWGATYLQGVAWLGEHAEPGAEVCVPIAGALPVWDSPRPDLKFGCGPEARYEMFVTGYDKITEYDARTPVFRISRYDSDLLRIYQTR